MWVVAVTLVTLVDFSHKHCKPALGIREPHAILAHADAEIPIADGTFCIENIVLSRGELVTDDQLLCCLVCMPEAAALRAGSNNSDSSNVRRSSISSSDGGSSKNKDGTPCA